jgi:hypothetical protein
MKFGIRNDDLINVQAQSKHLRIDIIARIVGTWKARNTSL